MLPAKSTDRCFLCPHFARKQLALLSTGTQQTPPQKNNSGQFSPLILPLKSSPPNPLSTLQGTSGQVVPLLKSSNGLLCSPDKVSKEISNCFHPPLASTAHSTHPEPFLAGFVFSLASEPLHTLSAPLPNSSFLWHIHIHFANFSLAIASSRRS